MDDNKRQGVRLAKELVELGPFAVEEDVRLGGAEGKRARASTSRYASCRESVLVAVRLAPDQRPGDRGLLGRRPRPGIHAEQRREEQGDDAARDQEPPTHPPRIRFTV